MKRAWFVIWMLGYPLLGVLSSYVDWLEGEHYSAAVEGITAVVQLAIWFGVGAVLWNDRRLEKGG